ncbi:hypothetical protein Tco_0833748 [Tanacetum coccineum]
MSLGNLVPPWHQFLDQKIRGAHFSLGIVAGERFVIELTPSMFPQRHVAGEGVKIKGRHGVMAFAGGMLASQQQEYTLPLHCVFTGGALKQTDIDNLGFYVISALVLTPSLAMGRNWLALWVCERSDSVGCTIRKGYLLRRSKEVRLVQSDGVCSCYGDAFPSLSLSHADEDVAIG